MTAPKLLSAETVRELFHQWSRRLPLRIGNGVKAEFLSVIDQAPDETPQPPDVAALTQERDAMRIALEQIIDADWGSSLHAVKVIARAAIAELPAASQGDT